MAILENVKTKVMETIGDVAEAVSKYKTLVEYPHVPRGVATHKLG